MQVHRYYSGSGYGAPAREIVEYELMEKHHWLPKQIAEMSYKFIQKLFLIQGQKQESARGVQMQAQAKSAAKSVSKGGNFTQTNTY